VDSVHFKAITLQFHPHKHPQYHNTAPSRSLTTKRIIPPSSLILSIETRLAVPAPAILCQFIRGLSNIWPPTNLAPPSTCYFIKRVTYLPCYYRVLGVRLYQLGAAASQAPSPLRKNLTTQHLLQTLHHRLFLRDSTSVCAVALPRLRPEYFVDVGLAWPIIDALLNYKTVKSCQQSWQSDIPQKS
jgi:hypothetical protein